MKTDDSFVTFRKFLWLLVIVVGTVFAVQAADLYALETLGDADQSLADTIVLTTAANGATTAGVSPITNGTYLPIAGDALLSDASQSNGSHPSATVQTSTPLIITQSAEVPNFAMVGDGGDLGQRARAVMKKSMPVIFATKIADITYVSLSEILAHFDGELKWRPGETEAILIAPDSIAKLIPGSTRATIDLQPTTLSAVPAEVAGKLMLPASALDQVIGSKTIWDERRRRFQVNSNEGTVHIVALEDIFQLVVSRSQRILQVYVSGEPVKAYPMCIGRGNNTPIGHFHIRNRAIWPPWRTYEGEYIPGGSGRNPLGARWLGTSARGHERGWTIGMHGTNQPSSIGKRISGGCMRMYNSDAIELFNNIPIGTSVWIHEESTHLPDGSTARLER